MIAVVQTRRFANSVKKLPKNHKQQSDDAVREILKNPDIGQRELGDLAGVYVYKFKINKQLMLLAYLNDNQIITLLQLGSHENFYRDLKKSK